MNWIVFNGYCNHYRVVPHSMQRADNGELMTDALALRNLFRIGRWKCLHVQFVYCVLEFMNSRVSKLVSRTDRRLYRIVWPNGSCLGQTIRIWVWKALREFELGLPTRDPLCPVCLHQALPNGLSSVEMLWLPDDENDFLVQNDHTTISHSFDLLSLCIFVNVIFRFAAPTAACAGLECHSLWPLGGFQICEEKTKRRPNEEQWFEQNHHEPPKRREQCSVSLENGQLIHTI